MNEKVEFKEIPINDLTPASYNPRIDLQPNDPEYQKLKKSIENFGFVEPIIWNKNTNNVVGGHQRLKVLKDLGYENVLCAVVNLSEENEKTLNIGLNKISGDWDEEKLVGLLEELETYNVDFDLTGFASEEIDSLMQDFHMNENHEAEDDNFDFDEELDQIEEPTTQKGQVYKLGNHYLMCGSSTEVEDVKALIGEEKMQLIVTDPPYNVDYTGKTKDALKIENDKMNQSSFYEFLFDVYSLLYEIIEDGCPIYVFHADLEGHNFRQALMDTGFKLAQTCIWVKQTMVMGRADFHWQHEPILYGWKPTSSHKWYSDRKQTTVWNFDRPMRNAEHPTMKPIELIAYPINISSKREDNVFDGFGGSGSTLMACEQTNRSCYMMELDPKYCDVIIKRWEQFTERKAELINATNQTERANADEDS